MRQKKEKYFASEADMCACFIAQVSNDWVSYCESCGWDILLVRKNDGFQIGIEAKLKLNAHVISQALETSSYAVLNAGPDCRAVLVPEGENSLEKICAYIGLTVIAIAPVDQAHNGYRYGRGNPSFRPSLPRSDHHHFYGSNWIELMPSKRHKLPEFVPDSRAGTPSPVKLTKWKIGAIKVAVTMERQGYVTRADFKSAGIDHRLWIAPIQQWLIPSDEGWTAGPRFPNFREQHPKNYEEIAAQLAIPTIVKTQGSLI